MGPKKCGNQNVNTDFSQLLNLIEEIKKDLSTKANEKSLSELLKVIEEKNRKIEMLESRVALMENNINRLADNIDANEQYSRRTSLRVLNIPLPCMEEGDENDEVDEEETADVCFSKVREVIREAGVDIPDYCIDRCHQIGKITEETDDEGNVVLKKQAMIVKFTTWRHHTILYRARKKLSGKKIFLDLTKKRFQLFKKCQDKVKDIPFVRYVFVDVNCSLIHFSSEKQLDEILN